MESLVDTIEHQKWMIKGWKIKFLLSDRQLQETKKLSRVSNWYEDIIVRDTWMERLRVCFQSIENFHQTFGTLPEIGDRLFDEETGLMIQQRSIDGNLKTITFVLTV